MKIEASGVIYSDQCEVQAAVCTARTSGVVTAVFETPIRRQITVCRACLQEMITSGEWEIAGARISVPLDVAVVSPDGRAMLAVEVKLRPPMTEDIDAWAIRVRRNMVTHGAVSPTAAFLLVAVDPGRAWLWRPGDPGAPDREPDRSFNISKRLLPQTEGSGSGAAAEHAVASWLGGVLAEDPKPDWLVQAGAVGWGPEVRVVEQLPIAV